MDKLFDNIKKGVNIAKTEAEKLTKAVVGKTTNIVDITKLNLAKNETEGKIKKLYEGIGEEIYKEYAEGNPKSGAVGDMCLEIERFKAELEGLKEQIAELKSTAVCASCGEANDKNSDYCSSCGAKLKEAETIVVTPDEVVDIIPED